MDVNYTVNGFASRKIVDSDKYYEFKKEIKVKNLAFKKNESSSNTAT